MQLLEQGGRVREDDRELLEARDWSELDVIMHGDDRVSEVTSDGTSVSNAVEDDDRARSCLSSCRRIETSGPVSRHRITERMQGANVLIQTCWCSLEQLWYDKQGP